MIQRFQMVSPHGVPVENAVAEWVSTADLKSARHAHGNNIAVSNIRIAENIAQLLDGLPDSTVVTKIGEPETEDAAHDAYFHIDRVEGTPAAVFVRMALEARLVFLGETIEFPVDISYPLLGLIDRSLADLAECLFGGTVDGGEYVSKWESRGQQLQVMTRWVHGHQIFAALTQGLIFSFQSIGHAVRKGNIEDVQRWADLTTSLLRGSGAAFVLTGDFSVDDYNTSIRPSMMPPAVQFCLSGLMSIDHRVLVQTMRDMKPALNSLRQIDKARHEAIYDALATVYDRHIYVCERFVGEQASLLTAGRTEKSGPQLIEQFKALRLKPLESPTHATRLTSPPRTPAAATCPFSKKVAGSGDIPS